MLNTWEFNEFMYQPKFDWEKDAARGGGGLMSQGFHQADIVRTIGGGMVESVRATIAEADPSRGPEGCYTAWIRFADGSSGTMVYNGYGHFDLAELHHWLSGTGRRRASTTNARARAWLATVSNENTFKERTRYGGPDAGDDYLALRREAEESEAVHQPFFGLTIASCERGDIRQTTDGLRIDTGTDSRTVSLPGWSGSHEEAELEELEAAIREVRPVIHDGPWAEASLELCLAIRRSARNGAEVRLMHQVPLPRERVEERRAVVVGR
jgi:phthalate 4,5-cis-dihydrodiol dehydrogenase